MAEVNKLKIGHVAGFVKATPNNDGSTTFRVGPKVEGQKFTLSESSPFMQKLKHAKRALVRFQVDGKNPTILVVIEEPSGRLISQYNADMA